MTPEVPRLKWTRTEHGSYEATDANGATWTLDQHPTAPSRQGKNPDWSEKWWLHPAGPETPETHEMCPIVTRRKINALHRHPDILRYADVLAAGWSMAWRMQNGQPLAEQLMRKGDVLAPLSALQGAPVLVHPQRLLDAELRTSRFEQRAYAAEQALRDAGLPVPGSARQTVTEAQRKPDPDCERCDGSGLDPDAYFVEGDVWTHTPCSECLPEDDR